jgi:predicted membrane channel-forming protein YqfA (hemolysin III family)
MVRSKLRIFASLFILIFGIIKTFISINGLRNMETVLSSGLLSSALIAIGGVIFTIGSVLVYKSEKSKMSKNRDDSHKIDGF